MDLHWIVPLILIALCFDFLNGFHDSANSIATVVATRVLSPQFAVFWAAFFNLVGPLCFGESVAKTIGKGIIDIHMVTSQEATSLVLGALTGAIAWNIITWYFGIPSSSSHALVGGLIGAGFYSKGLSIMVWEGIGKTVLFIFLSPVIGFILAGFTSVIVAWFCYRKTPSIIVILGSGLLGLLAFVLIWNKSSLPEPWKILIGLIILFGIIGISYWLHSRKTLFKTDRAFRKLQILSSALYSIGHGTNDAQKTMGIIFMLLVSAGQLKKNDPIPLWILLICSIAIALGTAFGGWRIVKTMGSKITRLTPNGGFCAETAGAIALYAASMAGIPVSTTHTITGCIVGVGTSSHSAVRWRVATRIVYAWIFTIPATAIIAFLMQALLHVFTR
jgi:PiT family inorganic phosphate transporter